MDPKIIGENIKNIRKTAGVNQITFASEVGITQSTLSSYESGNTIPSLEILYSIAEKYEISTDAILGLPHSTQKIDTVADIGDMLFEINKKKEVRYELDIHNHLPNDSETGSDKWYTAIVFYGNDSNYENNSDVCQMLESLENARSGFESYFTDYDMFQDWQKTLYVKYGDRKLSDKEIEDLSYDERISMRNQYMKEYLKNNKNK